MGWGGGVRIQILSFRVVAAGGGLGGGFRIQILSFRPPPPTLDPFYQNPLLLDRASRTSFFLVLIFVVEIQFLVLIFVVEIRFLVLILVVEIQFLVLIFVVEIQFLVLKFLIER